MSCHRDEPEPIVVEVFLHDTAQNSASLAVIFIDFNDLDLEGLWRSMVSKRGVIWVIPSVTTVWTNGQACSDEAVTVIGNC